MGVSPTSRRPSSSPSSKKEGPEAEKGKDFKLPSRKEPTHGKDQEEKKKKGLFDIAQDERVLQQKQEGPSVEKAEPNKLEDVKAAQSAAEVRQIGQLIHKMVETMHIGKVDGKTFASLDLKQSPEVPNAFAGANLNLSYEENGLVIRFDNFMTTQQESTAIALVEKNKEQLAQMAQALMAKNIQVAELWIGKQPIALPRIEPLPAPFRTEIATETETEQRERRGGEGEGGGEEGRGGPH